MLEVWNKIDNLSQAEADAYRTAAERDSKHCITSAITGEGLDELYEAIENALAEPVFNETLTLDFSQGKGRAWLYAHNVVLNEEQTEEGYVLEVQWTEKPVTSTKLQIRRRANY